MADAGPRRKRRGFAFFLKALVVGAGIVIVVAVVGDDELRASLRRRLGV